MGRRVRPADQGSGPAKQEGLLAGPQVPRVVGAGVPRIRRMARAHLCGEDRRRAHGPYSAGSAHFRLIRLMLATGLPMSSLLDLSWRAIATVEHEVMQSR